MKFHVTKANERGRVDHGWLKANHYFSFGNYYDPSKMSFGALRVINDDKIAPGSGFGTHPHQNMEIITIPLSGGVKHKDSVGNEGVIKAGEVQVMSAGTGIQHSEYNASEVEELNLFQIWIEPNQMQVTPRYQQDQYELTQDQWVQIVSPLESGSSENGVKIHQNAFINLSLMSAGASLKYKLRDTKNGIYVIAVDGEFKIADVTLKVRDAIGVIETDFVEIESQKEGKVLVIEVPI